MVFYELSVVSFQLSEGIVISEEVTSNQLPVTSEEVSFTGNCKLKGFSQKNRTEN